MTWWFALAILCLYVIYTLSAELILHLWHIGIMHQGNTDKRTLALTFDDGPHPDYTPQILDILRQYQVKATFFVVGEHAARYPHIVKQIVSEGHEVGSHSYRHHHAFLRTPLGTYRDIAKSKRELESITSRPIHYYRSPWGAMNWVVAFTCKILGMKQVLWSIRAIDWLDGEYVNDVVYRVVHRAHPGAIVLCHDAGGAVDAPKNTVAALPTIIALLQKLGFSFSTVGELNAALESQKSHSELPFANYPMWRKGLIFIWQIVEVSFSKLYHVLTIDAMFRISPALWRHGIRSDNTTGQVLIVNGSKAIDLHFQNKTLISTTQTQDNRAVVRSLRMVKTGLAELARVIEYHPDYADVQVVMAMTLMNRGLEMLGFHVEELAETKQKRHLESYMRFLMGMYHPQGFKRLQQGNKSLSLKLIWMTRDELLERYGQLTSIVSG